MGMGAMKYLGFLRRRWARVGLVAAAAVLTVGGIVVAGAGNGYPAHDMKLLSGAAWLTSSNVGQVTLLDGSSTEVAAQVQAAPAGNALEVVQQGSTAYVVDRTAGTVRRVDGATFDLSAPVTPIDQARAGLTAFASTNTLYTLDTQRGLLASSDPRTLAGRGQPMALSTRLTNGTATVDDAGRLWIVDNATGDLSWISGGKRSTHRQLTRAGQNVITIANGDPVVVNRADRKVVTVDPDTGDVRGTIDVDLRPDDTIQVSGSPHSQRLYLIASRGILDICELGSGGACDTVVPLDATGGDLGAAVEAGNRLFIPNYTTGQVWIVDLTRPTVVAKPQVLTPPGKFQLLARDGVVFFNDPATERAGVIRLDGSVKDVAKYDPKDPSKGLRSSLADASGPPNQSAASGASSATPLPSTQTPPDSKQPNDNQVPPQAGQFPPLFGDNPPAAGTNPLPDGQNPSGGSPGGGNPPGSPPSTAPTLRITVSKSAPMVNEDVTLKVDTTTGTAPASSHWDFGDGQQADSVTTSHHWAAAKTYQVSVQATMPDGQQGTTSVSIQVSEIPKVKLTVAVPTNGSVTGPSISCPSTCTATYTKGQSVTLTARPNANSTFAGWGGACAGTGSCTITMNGDKTVSASFRSALDPFLGTWVNVNPNTRNIPQIQVTQTSATTATLHVWGACTPSWCDWGTTTATLSNGELHAFYDQGFSTQTIRITQVNGQLIVYDHCHFTDNSGRQDFDSQDTMKKKG